MWLEMVRDVDDDLIYRDLTHCLWMDSAEVDAKPFLFYLQYLTLSGFGLRRGQVSAFNSFATCVHGNRRVASL